MDTKKLLQYLKSVIKQLSTDQKKPSESFNSDAQRSNDCSKVLGGSILYCLKTIYARLVIYFHYVDFLIPKYTFKILLIFFRSEFIQESVFEVF